MRRAEIVAFRQKIERVFDKAAVNMNREEMILARDLCKPWEPGAHTVGEHFTADGQLWTCFQAYNNAIYPDIRPGNAAWFTFNRPYHGTSRETAMPWVRPTGAHDIYQTGEYMVYTDGKLYRCRQGTNFSPDEYAPAWEVQA